MVDGVDGVDTGGRGGRWWTVWTLVDGVESRASTRVRPPENLVNPTGESPCGKTRGSATHRGIALLVRPKVRARLDQPALSRRPGRLCECAGWLRESCFVRSVSLREQH